MDTNFNSEHGFNCKNAEHMPGTNRYVFKYPETWYSSMNDRRLCFGLRSIIVKPEQLFIDFSSFEIAIPHRNLGGVAQDRSLYTCVSPYQTGKAVVRPYYNYGYMMPDRAWLGIEQTVTESESIDDFCRKFNDAYNTFLDNYDKTYERQSATRIRELKDDTFKYEPVMLMPDMVKASYNSDRVFSIDAGSLGYFMAYYCITGLVANTNPKPNLHLQTPTQTDIYTHQTNAFPKDFEILLGLHFPEGLSLNKILSGLAGINKDYTIEMAKQDCERYGIVFTDVYTIVYEEGLLYQLITKNTIICDTTKPSEKTFFTYCVAFKRLTVKNVWSRNDILIRSSIAEMDEKNYLGYSTMNESSGVCIYSTPKMYAIESHDHKFWIDLYDSLQESPIELPEKVVLIIEAILYQNMKEFDTRG